MKVSRMITYTLGIAFLLSTTSCVITPIKFSGKHKGWYKNPHNPHHPHSNNPGKGHQKNKHKEHRH